MSNRIEGSNDNHYIEELRRQAATKKANKVENDKKAFQDTLRKESAQKQAVQSRQEQVKEQNEGRKINSQQRAEQQPLPARKPLAQAPGTKAEEKKSSSSSSSEKTTPSRTNSSAKDATISNKREKEEGALHKEDRQERGGGQTLTENAVSLFSQSQNNSGTSGGNGEGNLDDQFFAQAATFGRLENIQQVVESQLSSGLYDGIVNQVYEGVNQQGLAQFTIQLNSNVLNGASIQVAAEGKLVSLSFKGLSAKDRNLLKSNEHELTSRFSQKGLRLLSLELSDN